MLAMDTHDDKLRFFYRGKNYLIKEYTRDDKAAGTNLRGQPYYLSGKHN